VSGPDPAVAAVRNAVRRTLTDLRPGDLVLVACSGGADSLALAAGTVFVAERLGLRAGAVIVDHQWRTDSGGISARVERDCRELGLDPVRVVTVDSSAGPGGPGPEAAARQARYRALEEVAETDRAVTVLLGHTRDDQAETVLLGLSRGSGARSLSGMPAVRGRFRRPLLDLPRTVTAGCCRAVGLRPWQDPANTDPAYTRSRLRQVMPALEGALGPGLPESLARTADLLREDADTLDLLAARVVDAVLADADQIRVDVPALAREPVAVRRRVLLEAARRAGCPPGALARTHVLAVDALVTRWRGQGPVHLPGGMMAARACDNLVFREQDEVPRGQERERRAGQ
jgi:tRNA(Ile)-lysidine synthetase-like protein